MQFVIPLTCLLIGISSALDCNLRIYGDESGLIPKGCKSGKIDWIYPRGFYTLEAEDNNVVQIFLERSQSSDECVNSRKIYFGRGNLHYMEPMKYTLTFKGQDLRVPCTQ